MPQDRGAFGRVALGAGPSDSRLSPVTRGQSIVMMLSAVLMFIVVVSYATGLLMSAVLFLRHRDRRRSLNP